MACWSCRAHRRRRARQFAIDGPGRLHGHGRRVRPGRSVRFGDHGGECADRLRQQAQAANQVCPAAKYCCRDPRWRAHASPTTGVVPISIKCKAVSPGKVPSPTRIAASKGSVSKSIGRLSVSTANSISGCAARKLPVRCISQAEAKGGAAASRRRRRPGALSAGAAARRRSAKARPVVAARAVPARVGSTARCARVNSRSPRARSSLRIRWLTAEGERCSAAAAALKLRAARPPRTPGAPAVRQA